MRSGWALAKKQAGPVAGLGLCLERHGRSGSVARSTRGSGALAACVFDSEEVGRDAGLGEGETSPARRGGGRGTWRANPSEQDKARAAPWMKWSCSLFKREEGRAGEVRGHKRENQGRVEINVSPVRSGMRQSGRKAARSSLGGVGHGGYKASRFGGAQPWRGALLVVVDGSGAGRRAMRRGRA